MVAQLAEARQHSSAGKVTDKSDLPAGRLVSPRDERADGQPVLSTKRLKDLHIGVSRPTTPQHQPVRPPQTAQPAADSARAADGAESPLDQLLAARAEQRRARPHALSARRSHSPVLSPGHESFSQAAWKPYSYEQSAAPTPHDIPSTPQAAQLYATTALSLSPHLPHSPSMRPATSPSVRMPSQRFTELGTASNRFSSGPSFARSKSQHPIEGTSGLTTEPGASEPSPNAQFALSSPQGRAMAASKRSNTMSSEIRRRTAPHRLGSGGRQASNPFADLITKDDIPDDTMRELFKEVQQYAINIGLTKGPLTNRKAAELRALFARSSHRLSHIPSAVVQTVDGQMCTVPLPGPRGVPGYEVDSQGRIKARPNAIGPYLAASSHVSEILAQLDELEKSDLDSRQGLEADEKLVDLWRALGGSAERHSTGPAPMLSSRAQSVPDPTVFSLGMNAQTTSDKATTKPRLNLALDTQGLQSKQVLNRASSGALTSPHSPGRLPTSPNRKPDSARLALQPSMLYMTHGQVKTGKAEAKRLARRRSSRIAGHTVYNVNTLTGAELGYYASVIKDIEALSKPAELAPALQVGFRSPTPDQITQEDSEALGQADNNNQTQGKALGWMKKPSDWDAWDSLNEFDDSTPHTSATHHTNLTPRGAPPKTSAFKSPRAHLVVAIAETTKTGGAVPHSLNSAQSVGSPFGKRALKSSLARAKSSEGRALEEGTVQEDIKTKDVIGSNEDEHLSPEEALDQAWTLLRDTLSRGGKRLVQRAAQTPSTAKVPGRASARQSEAGVASRRVTSMSGQFSFNRRATDEEEADEIDVATTALLRRFSEAWNEESSLGKAQTSALDKLKSILTDITQPQSGNGPVTNPTAWGPELSAWLPSQEEAEHLERLIKQAMRPVLGRRRAAHEPGRWLPDAVTERAMQPGSKVKIQPRREVPAALEVARRHVQDDEYPGSVGLAATHLHPQALTRRLEHLSALSQDTLDLALANTLTRTDMGIVVQVLKGAWHITQLKATDGVLDASGVSGFLDVLAICTHLKGLDVSHTPAFGAEAGDRLGNLLHPRCKLSLTHINLEGCPITDEGFDSIALGVQFNKKLTVLNMANTGLRDAALLKFDQVLEQNIVLSSLNLAENNFTATGLSRLVQDLQGNVSLTDLSLSACQLDDVCAAKLADLLPVTKALKRLDLSNNRIGPIGAASLSEALSRLDQLPTSERTTPSNSTASATTTATTASTSSAASNAGRRVTLTTMDNSTTVASTGRGSAMGDSSPAGNTSSAPGGSLGGGEGSAASVPGGVRGGAGRASGLAGLVGCPLESLVLNGNPLGIAGIINLYKGLNQLDTTQCTFTYLGLDNVPLYDLRAHRAAPHAPLWDPHIPCGHLTLNVEDPAHRKVVTNLMSQGAKGLVECVRISVDGEPCSRWPVEWLEEMPEEGVVEVKVIRRICPPSNSPTLGPVLARVLTCQLAAPSASDLFRATLISAVTHVTCVRASEVAGLLCHFEYSSTKLDCARELITACVDAHNLIPALLSPRLASHQATITNTASSSTRPACKAVPRVKGSGSMQQPVCTPEELVLLLNHADIQAYLHTPVPQPLDQLHDIAPPGHYRLDLSQQVQRLVAASAVALAVSHQHISTVSHSPAVMSVQGQGAAMRREILHTPNAWHGVCVSWADELHLGLATCPLRNITYDNKPLHDPYTPKALTISDLPCTGTLEFDLVLTHNFMQTSDTSTTNTAAGEAARPSTVTPVGGRSTSTPALVQPGGSLGPPSPSPYRGDSSGCQSGLSQLVVGSGFSSLAAGGLSQLVVGESTMTRASAVGSGGSVMGSGRMQSLARMQMSTGTSLRVWSLNERVASAVEQRVRVLESFETLYRACVECVGLSVCDPRLEGWETAATHWAGHRYTSQLTSLCETAVERAAALHAAAAQARQAPTADQDTQVPPSSEDPDSKKKGGEKKGGGKKGKDKKGGGGGGAKEAERLAALAAELRAAKEQKLMEAARVCLGDVLVYARSTPMTALQVIQLMQLLPDVSQRLELFIASRPLLVDPSHTLDIVLALSAPTPLPGDAAPPSARVSNADSAPRTDDLGPATTTTNTHDTTGATTSLTPARGVNGGWMQPRPLSGTPPMPAMQPEGSGATPASTTVGSSDKTPAISMAGGVEDGDYSGGALALQWAAGRCGMLALCSMWASPDTLQAALTPPCGMSAVDMDSQGVLLDVAKPEHVQIAMRICRWCDMTRDEEQLAITLGGATLQSVVTDAGNLALEHTGTWSYWEQILGWLCARVPDQDSDNTNPSQSLPLDRFAPVTFPEPKPTPPTKSTTSAANAGKQQAKAGTGSKAAGKAAKGNAGAGAASAAPATPAAAPAPVRLGKLRLLRVTSTEAQERAAAVLIQAVWRGWRLRRALAATIRDEALTTGAPLRGRRRWGLCLSLLSKHMPRASDPAAQSLAARMSMKFGNGLESEEEETVEYVQPLLPVYPNINQPTTSTTTGYDGPTDGGMESKDSGPPLLKLPPALARTCSATARGALGAPRLSCRTPRGDPTHANAPAPPSLSRSASKCGGDDGTIGTPPTMTPRAVSFRAESFGHEVSERLSVYSSPWLAQREPQGSVPDPSVSGADAAEEGDATGLPKSGRPRAAARWQACWAVYRFWRRVQRLQRLGGYLALRHAQIEMRLNADHLFPLEQPKASPEPSS